MDSVTVNVSGGVSGLFAALKLAENGCKDVTVLEVQCFSAEKLHSKHNVGDKYKGDEVKECFTKFFVTLLVFGPLTLYTLTHGAVHSLTSPCARLTHGLEAGCGVCPTMTELSVRSPVSLF